MKKSVRLDKLLSAAGYGSRKDMKKLIRLGTVTVNGKVVKNSALHVNLPDDTVVVDGCAVDYKEFVYLMLNKPSGYISATEDINEPTVLDLVPPNYGHYNIFPVGRLDKDTEGLLLLTNDGKLAHDLLSPKKHVPKTYFVEVDGVVTKEHVDEFSEGIVLEDGYKTLPADLNILEKGKTSKVELTIYEGKFHQVKRMFASKGLKVLYLKRLSMGKLQLDINLSPGNVRELTPAELELLREK